MSATVTAVTPDGRPVLQSPVGLMTLDATAGDLRIGTQLQLTVVAAPRPAPSAPQNFPASFVEQRAWPALEEAVSHLAQRSAAGGAPAAPPALPQSNSRLAANLMLFMAALRGGDLNAWLGGDAAGVLESERPGLARQISEEFAQLARVLNEASADDWRTAVIPYFNGAHLEPVQMHSRGGKASKGDSDEGEGSRFIIDIVLSQLGRIQLDGFIKKRGDKKTFDLIVRTDRPLPQQMRLDINQIFTGFGEAAGLRGGITFQARTRFVEVALARLDESVKEGLIV